jgi:hypothetical protein
MYLELPSNLYYSSKIIKFKCSRALANSLEVVTMKSPRIFVIEAGAIKPDEENVTKLAA